MRNDFGNGTKKERVRNVDLPAGGACAPGAGAVGGVPVWRSATWRAKAARVVPKSMVALILLGVVASPRAEAGWSSSGGEIVLDSQNPWFVKGVRKVDACLEIDEASFGLPRAEAKRRIEEAWAFWRDAFKVEEAATGRGVAAQELRWLESCDAGADLAFQLGSLRADQVSRLPDVSRMLALSVRTDYDRVKLRGRGFIYVSPQTGPLSLRVPGLSRSRWALSEGSLLRLVLIHELGHVFGLRHSGGPEGENLFEVMNPRFPETVTNEFWANVIATELKDAATVRTALVPFGGGFRACEGRVTPTSELRAFWGLSPSARTLAIEIESGKLRVLESDEEINDPDPVDGFRLVGHASLGTEIMHFDPLGAVYLPAEQKVFPLPNPDELRSLELPHGLRYSALHSGVYKPAAGGAPRTLEVDLRAGAPRITGLFDGKLVGDLMCEMRGPYGDDEERVMPNKARRSPAKSRWLPFRRK